MSRAPRYNLSGFVDFKESFAQANIHSLYRHPQKRIPLWTKDDAAVQKLLLQVFPKLETDDRQRWNAGHWMQVIQNYFRMNQPASVVADEMAITIPRVRSLIRSIHRAGSGLTTRGTERKRSGAGRPVGAKTDKSKEIKPKSRKRRVTNPLTGAERVARFRRRQQLAEEIKKISLIIEHVKINNSDIECFYLKKFLRRLDVEKKTLDKGRRYARRHNDTDTSRKWERGLIASLMTRFFGKNHVTDIYQNQENVELETKDLPNERTELEGRSA